jgi:hypothetical protein
MGSWATFFVVDANDYPGPALVDTVRERQIRDTAEDFYKATGIGLAKKSLMPFDLAQLEADAMGRAESLAALCRVLSKRTAAWLLFLIAVWFSLVAQRWPSRAADLTVISVDGAAVSSWCLQMDRERTTWAMARRISCSTSGCLTTCSRAANARLERTP